MNRSDIPSLDDLRAFEAAARLGSIRRAADHLALTHGAISRRVTKLSDDLGFALFEKSGRGLRLTAAGETLFLTVNRFLGELQETVQGLRSTAERENALVISCEPSVAVKWLIPRLGKFYDSHPDIALHLSIGGGMLDFRRYGVDLAIRRLDFPMPENWHVRRLFSEEVGPVMSPQVAPAFEAGSFIGLGSKTRHDAWAQWLRASSEHVAPAEMRFYDHHFVMIEAAVAGLGVALSPFVLAADDIEKGRLVAPSGFRSDGSHYGLILPSSEIMPNSLSRLVAWLEEECLRDFGQNVLGRSP